MLAEAIWLWLPVQIYLAPALRLCLVGLTTHHSEMIPLDQSKDGQEAFVNASLP